MVLPKELLSAPVLALWWGWGWEPASPLRTCDLRAVASLASPPSNRSCNRSASCCHPACSKCRKRTYRTHVSRYRTDVVLVPVLVVQLASMSGLELAAALAAQVWAHALATALALQLVSQSGKQWVRLSAMLRAQKLGSEWVLPSGSLLEPL